jgi:hypothetical protein
LEAESHAVSLETNGAAPDYIQLYQGSVETLTASLERIRHAANDILRAVVEPAKSNDERPTC